MDTVRDRGYDRRETATAAEGGSGSGANNNIMTTKILVLAIFETKPAYRRCGLLWGSCDE
jgi:hypothetical protein